MKSYDVFAQLHTPLERAALGRAVHPPRADWSSVGAWFWWGLGGARTHRLDRRAENPQSHYHTTMTTPHIHPSALDYDEVIDGIFIGTNQCCRTHFDERLRRAGITADISLEEERLDQPVGVAFYLWLPAKDKTAPTQSQLRVGVAVLEELVRLKQKVYVHCKLGHGRAPTLVAAYIVKKRGQTVREAIDFVSHKRDHVHIEDVQRNALEAYAALLRRALPRS